LKREKRDEVPQEFKEDLAEENVVVKKEDVQYEIVIPVDKYLAYKKALKHAS